MSGRRDPFKVEFSPLPIPSESPSADGGSYFYLSRQWMAYVRGMVSYLGMRRFWQDAPEQYDQILQWVYQLLEEIDLPTDTIEIPVYVPNQWEDDDDIEDDTMCKCGNAVHYDVQEKRQFYLDDNCRRVYIDNPPVTSPITYDEWLGFGEPETTDAPAVPHDNPNYKTTESLKCAKATALVNEMWNVIGIYEGFGEVTGFLGFIGLVAGFLAAWFPAMVGTLSASSIAASLSSLASDIGLENLGNKLQAIHENTALKNDLICTLVPLMTTSISAGSNAGTPIPKISVSDSDIKNAMEQFKALFPTQKEALALLAIFPMNSWKSVVTPQIAETECGCTDYAPPDLTEGMGQIKVYLTASTFPPNGEFGHTPASLKATPLQSQMGVKIAANHWRTEDSGNEGNHRYGLLFEMPEGVVTGGFTFDIQWVGATQGKGLQVGYYHASGENQGFEKFLENATVDIIELSAGLNDAELYWSYSDGARYVWVTAWTVGTTVADGIYVKALDFKFRVQAADGSWTRIGVQPETNFPVA